MRVLFFFLLAMTEVSGQTLSGRVTQASGAPLPFAHLRLWRADSSLAAGAVADTGGYFVLRPSVSSAYRLTADAVGYT
ncbi:MAG: carboxypeptidase regulatory-like domain-containing protein, partial [Siphonobacter aquaeclarae]|nr:carboxypeptidase regulatory-like domain-containing protein [Siphonobacter aquaeclarae]